MFEQSSHELPPGCRTAALVCSWSKTIKLRSFLMWEWREMASQPAEIRLRGALFQTSKQGKTGCVLLRQGRFFCYVRCWTTSLKAYPYFRPAEEGLREVFKLGCSWKELWFLSKIAEKSAMSLLSSKKEPRIFFCYFVPLKCWRTFP